MAESFRRRVAAGSVRQSLYAMRTDLLPEAIREDSLAAWVMNFDELRSRPSEPQRDDRRSDLWAIDLFVTSSLQRQIPFYFASLFHIGRQWKVSEQAIVDVEKASGADNLRTSAELTFKRVQRRQPRLATMFGREPEIATRALSVLLDSSRHEHAARLHESRAWWSAWQAEVGQLRDHIERIQESAYGEFTPRFWREVLALTMQAYRPSQLRISMEAGGVKFPHQTETARPVTVYSELLWPLVLIGAMSKFREPFFHDLGFELRHMLHEVKEEINYGELRRVALERLRRKYAEADPFEVFLPMRNPATEDLRNLVVEHTLPGYGHTYSPWLATWKQCVEYNDSSSLKVIRKDISDAKVIAGFARSADCAIKNALPDQFLPGETWEDLVQRLFESAWIATIANQIVSTNSNLGESGWTFDLFATLVQNVSRALSEFGYRLTAPSLERLVTLWNKLHSDKRWTDTDW